MDTRLNSKPLTTTEEGLSALKARYLRQATAPLDGMWLFGFVPAAQHHGLFHDDRLVGFYCVDGDGFLLQFMVAPPHEHEAAGALEAIVSGAGDAARVLGAFSSTAEPHYLATCLDVFGSFEVHTLMYQRDDSRRVADDVVLPLQRLVATELQEAVRFAHQAIGAPEAWLSGYYAGLIAREELYGYRKEARLVALGERRVNDEHQTDCAELGVIVAESERGKGIATQVLRDLVVLNERADLRSICSTEKGNVGAQRAISRAGFVPRHRIVRFTA